MNTFETMHIAVKMTKVVLILFNITDMTSNSY